MSQPSFENLRVLKLAEQIGDQIWNIVFKWPSFARWSLGQQLVRAADSIGANIAEGAGRGSFQDNRRFVRIARGSMNEVRFFLQAASRRRLIEADEAAPVLSILNRLGPMLNAYLRSIGSDARQAITDPNPEDNR